VNLTEIKYVERTRDVRIVILIICVARSPMNRSQIENNIRAAIRNPQRSPDIQLAILDASLSSSRSHNIGRDDTGYSVCGEARKQMRSDETRTSEDQHAV